MTSPARGAGRPWGGERPAGAQRSEGGGGRRRHRHREARAPRVFPNFFVGVRVRSVEVAVHVERLQQAVRDELPELSPCLIDPRTLHVTLCVLRLADDKAIADASEVLRSETLGFMAENTEVLALEFSRWGFFGRHDVLYAAMEPTQWLETLAERLHGALERLGLTTEPFRRPYTPHLTVWKNSKDRGVVKAVNATRPLTAPVQDELARVLDDCEPPCGVDIPASLELLSMREREEDGYYKAYASQRLSTP